ncbi:double-strand break repair helicase AddA [Sedimentitalea todarodis]|uniref:DNA 3'-5' helicase n=1 Tax=Sedimentitalea todarodis TaxID=1631240 RepID=A0ABU3VJ56_9RHOB|nr:double-strand break repair helicase AddA [Sedimentitalea todarodis]MDU9006040.1 double-strand break repair helicase AddA [Sedimentitalea todarodis]
MPRDDATERQVTAARPDASTWLAANAGSGKTRVLTDRVARLLLEDVRPEHILCLTYTKAAASEMQNRLFRRLGDWAMRGDGDLTATLVDLGVSRSVSPHQLAHARTLFARAIETPGGLKIQTIHSFCASLLRRFPLEAGVSPQFTEMEDRAAELLQAEIVEDFADGPQANLVDGIAQFLSDTTFDGLTRALVQQREAFAHPVDQGALWRSLDLPVGYDETRLRAEVFFGAEAELLDRLRAAVNGGSKTEQNLAAKLAVITTPDLSDLPALESAFLTGKDANSPFSAKIGAVPTKKTQGDNPDLMPGLDALMLRIEAARPLRLGLACARKSLALHSFAAAFLPEYARRKQLRGWLDFDDLILKARQLLNDPAVAQWVLYRLDGGIDHILVDEAQDTSPVQWDVIEKLAQEFTSGEGARGDKPRTIFVVGDKKQSIYSFQGADPEEFDRMQTEFSQRLAGSGEGLQDLTLEYSFRSSEAILRLVDIVFAGHEDAGFRTDLHHRAFKSNLPGRVDLWPVVERVDDADDRVWTDPIDRPSPRHHNVILAEQIATSISRMIADAETIPVDGDAPGELRRRKVQAGDFLILVQRRSDLFAEIIRACKAAGLPIAGADRLKVGAELAVKDLAALLSFLATPEDSLSLATALKSPLFGWDEQTLFDLAHRRDSTFLWTALRKRSDEYPETMAILNDLRGQTDFLRPYDLVERILTRHDGRRKLLARLGSEAEDGINALLSQALSFERADIPSLTGFLVWMETDDLEIKRQMGTAGNMVRVMTVHGAKGLESPIVILPDTGPRRPPRGGEIMTVDDVPLWRMTAVDMPKAMSTAHAEAQQRQLNERLRLLYVALTRAEKWLIVTAAGDLDKNGDSWYQMVETALTEAGAEQCVFESGPGLRLAHLDWHAPEQQDTGQIDQHTVVVPEIFSSAATPPKPGTRSLSPSDLGGAKALPGDSGLDEEAAKLRGAQIHLLLEHLPDMPQAGWNEAAFGILHGLDSLQIAPLLAEARTVLKNPDLYDVFARDTLAEVPVTAEIYGRRFHGTIDRLIVGAKSVRAIDFKTNATVPAAPEDCPDGLLRQMGAYAAMLGQVYPDHRIETAILWTRTATLMPFPHDLVSDALGRAPSLDDGAVRS